MACGKTAQTLLFLGLINEDKMKATPRIHFPEIHSEINILSQKYSEINVLPPILRLNLFPEMYSENKFTSPKYIPRGANERKHFQLCCKYFPRVLQKHLIDQEGGRGSSQKTENMEQFDVVHTILTILTSARLRHSADFRRGRNPVSHLWSDSAL